MRNILHDKLRGFLSGMWNGRVFMSGILRIDMPNVRSGRRAVREYMSERLPEYLRAVLPDVRSGC